jgi:hypothetical protein
MSLCGGRSFDIRSGILVCGLNEKSASLCEIVKLEKKTIIRLIPLQANNCLLSNFLFFFIVQEKNLKSYGQVTPL